MKIIEVEQGSPEWIASRRCMVTGTKLKFVMGGGEGRRGLIAELIAEEATEQAKEFTTTTSMDRGNAEEPFAVKEFEKRTGKTVDRVGLCVSDEFEWLGCSPDGLVKNNGKYTEAIEVKCPDSKQAILYRIENQIPLSETGLLGVKGGPLAGAPFLGIPSGYKWQVVNYFIVNQDLEKMYFLVYDARFINNESKLYTVTIERQNEVLQQAIQEAKTELVRFRNDWMKWKDIVLPTDF